MTRIIKTSQGKKYFFSEEDQVGQGSYATVYKGFEAKTKQAVAIKVVGETFAKKKKTPKYHEIAKREVDILQKLDNDPHLLRIIDTAEDEDYAYIITEFCEGGSLRHRLKNSKFEESKAIKYLYDIAKGLSSLHQKGIMHRDINLQNILLSNGTCVIGDFGSAVAQKTSDKAAGTPTYQAPELHRVQPGHEYTKQIDVWSMGVVFFKMLFGRKIYKEYQALIEDDEDGIRRFPRSPQVSMESIRLLDRMLRLNPNKRITSQEVLKDHLFNNDEMCGSSFARSHINNEINHSEEDSDDDDEEEEITKEEIKKESKKNHVLRNTKIDSQIKEKQPTHHSAANKSKKKAKGKNKHKNKQKNEKKSQDDANLARDENNILSTGKTKTFYNYFLVSFGILALLGIYLYLSTINHRK